jgi:diacylglycerol O-acyltransferase / wax synthase
VAERLPGVDAGFLYMETPTQHMHTLKIALIDTSSLRGGYTQERLQRELARRLHLLPPFRRRLVQDPLRLHHPSWVDDPDFDLTRQLRHATVPAPGGKAEFEQLVGDIAGTPLDRSRPLWEMWVCDGLDDGRIGIVTKMHHAVADGVAANALLANSLTDLGGAPPTTSAPVPRERLPNRWRLALANLVERLRLLVRMPRLIATSVRGGRALGRYRRGLEVRPPRPVLDSSKAPWNGALTPRRSFSTATLSLADAKRVKAAHGVTLNDVVLGVVAGALRMWLAEQGHPHPDRALTAGVPIATDPKDAPPRLGGNHVGNLFTSLATDLDDPVERLQRIAATMREAKQFQTLMGLDLLERWWEHTPPLPFTGYMRLFSGLHLADRVRPAFNVVVSNVAGPREELSMYGARLTDIFSVGPIIEGIALNITVWSYEDRLAFSALACPDTLPDLPSLTRHLGPALDELVATTGTPGRPDDENKNVFL